MAAKHTLAKIQGSITGQMEEGIILYYQPRFIHG